MASSMRVGLLAHEKARREEVIKAAEKLQPGKGEMLREIYSKGNLQKQSVEEILKLRIGALPLVSADYQYWYEDFLAWKLVFGKSDGFIWHAPPAVVQTGFSRPFLEAFYDKHETEEEKAAREKRVRTLQEKWAAMQPKGLDSADEAVGPVQFNSGDIIIPKFDDKDRYEAPLEEKVALWRELFGKHKWEDGYAPMEVYIPEEVDPTLAIGPKDRVNATLIRASGLLGGREPWPVRLYARLRKDSEAKFGMRFSLFVDWTEGQDLSDPFWRQSIYFAVLSLWELFYKWLKGTPVNIIESLEKAISGRMDQHRALFSNVAVRKMTIQDQALRRAREVARIEGNAARVEDLVRKQKETLVAAFDRAIERKLAKAVSRDEKLQLLVKFVTEGLQPLPLTLAERRESVGLFADVLLKEVVDARMCETEMNLGTLLFDLNEIMTDPESRWEKVLPRGYRYEAIGEVLHLRHLDLYGLDEESKSRINAQMAKWAGFKEQFEWSSDEDDDLATAVGDLAIQGA